MEYHEPLYRPPSEADSLIFQLAYGCPHNTCLFCPMYKGVQYAVKPLAKLLEEINEMAVLQPDTKRIFLGDGDAMCLPFTDLQTVFNSLNDAFPKLARISMYSNGSSIISKTPEQLQFLKSKKLFTLYMGLESGSDDILRKVKKQDNVQDMIDAVKITQKLDIRMSVMVLLGIGGRLFSKQHAKDTAFVINKMSPKFLAALRFIQAPGFEMFDGYTPVTEFEAVQELYWIIQDLDLKNTVFRANHTSNPVPISARFPKDKEILLNTLGRMLAGTALDKKGPGHIPFFM